MTAPAEQGTLPITDEEVREWARSSGRKVGERGRVSPTLRAEYERELGELGHPAPPAGQSTAGGEPGGAESDSKPPRAARQERTPKRVRPPASDPLGKLRGWFSGPPASGTRPTARKPPKPAAEPRPRVPLVRLVEKGWGRVAQIAEHANIPVARTMQWQAPYIGVVAEDVISGTPVDKYFQWAARADNALSGIGSMVAMPIIVGMITSERNDPEKHGLAAIARQQALHFGLQECIDAQLEMFGSRDLASKIAKSAGEVQERSKEIAKIMSMIFAAVPEPVNIPDNATEAEVIAAREKAARNAEHERQTREAAAAIHFLPSPAEPDMRGQAAELAAAKQASSAAAAVAESERWQAHAAGLAAQRATIDG